jgi:hypothetical protein
MNNVIIKDDSTHKRQHDLQVEYQTSAWKESFKLITAIDQWSFIEFSVGQDRISKH